MVARIRQQLVQEGKDGALTLKRSPNSARKRIFDGASEAKLIASARSEPPQGYARWTLQMLEGRVVELNIVETCTPIPAKPGATETRRLRVSAQRHRQPVHDIRTPGRLAAGRSVSPSYART